MSKCMAYYLDRTMPELDVLLEAIWSRLHEDRLLNSLFYDGSIYDVTDFKRELTRDGCLPFVVFCDCDIAGIAWLNGIIGRRATAHFAIFRKFWGRRSRNGIGWHFWRYVLTRKDERGYLLDCLVGITPETLPLAWKAALQCGWRLSGELPEACWSAELNKSVKGVMTCATRELLGVSDSDDVGAIWEY